MSVLVEDDGGIPGISATRPPAVGSGETNGLVVVLRAVSTWKLDGNRD